MILSFLLGLGLGVLLGYFRNETFLAIGFIWGLLYALAVKAYDGIKSLFPKSAKP